MAVVEGRDRGDQTPPAALAEMLRADMDATDALIGDRMTARHAPRIRDVAAHIFGAGGKRLRPLLALSAARLVGDPRQDHIRLAATVEFIHTATLLHDDVIDESGQRRGRPTANLLWDNTSSVLVGDFLFARAFELMVETGSLRVLGILSRAAATISEGEVLQLTAARSLATDEATYLTVIRGKTAALFAAACESGALVAGGTDDQAAALARYGDALGVAFQIADDLLDYEGTDATGKSVGDDLRERKMTLPVIRAVAAADCDERAFWQRVIETGRQEPGDLAEARALLEQGGALDSARSAALGWAGEARSALAALPAGPIRDRLADLADYAVARIS